MRSTLYTLAMVALTACRAPRAATPDTGAPVASVALDPSFVRGVSYAHDWSNRGARGYGTASDREQLRRIRALGATWISVMPFGYMASVDADVIRASYDRPGSESDAALGATIDAAHAAGLKVLLKPHLWVRGSWPGAVRPPNDRAATLLEHWSSITLHYADLAQAHRVEALSLGVEMDELVRMRTDSWRSLAARVRSRYRGTITYCANWGSAETLPLWDAVDVIGVNHYAPLTTTAGEAALQPPERGTVFERARRAMHDTGALGRRWGRPVWLTEAGFRRDARALVEPWAWPSQAPAEAELALGRRLQALGLEAVLAAVAREPGVRAVFVWKWFSSGDHEDEGSGGFMVHDGAAERVLRAAFGAQ